MLPNTAQEQQPDSLGLLAGGVAHDFNNLLMAILGNADLALSELPPDCQARTSISEIHAVALRASDLCQQMLIYSGRGHFNLKVIELNHLANGLLPLLESIVPMNVTLKQELSASTVFIQGDFARIQQILLNLTTNAAESLNEKKGTITIETGVQDFTAEMLEKSTMNNSPPSGRYVFLRVSDTGSGMEPNTRARLFDPFFTTKFAGRGMGLSVVLGITIGHKGAILVDTAPGTGSTLTILFPEAASSDYAGEPAETIKKVDSDWNPKGLVLLADDEPDVRRVAAKMLKRMGFEVMLAQDGMEAVEIFRDNTDIIDMVVLDLTMPRLGGREAMLHIREMAPGISILLSSGYSDNASLTGSSGFIQKPYTQARFREALRKVAKI